MSELRNFKVNSHKALNQCKIENLGRINIICGKNNSGKTTLLEVINNKEKIVVGEIVKDETINEFNDAWKKNSAMWRFTWRGNQQSYLNLFKSFEVKNILTKILSNKVSPKRNIINPASISNIDKVDSEGKNIISKLFELRNKLSGTEESNLYYKVSDVFRKVSDGYNFEIEIEQEELTLFFSKVDKRKWISAKDCGLGLQDLLVILYFAIEPEFSIVLIEEPENHIHPEMQRRLLRFLSEETEKQYFISTHSNIFLNTTYVNKIFFTSFEDGEIKISDATKRTEILNDLGYSVSDNLVSDLIILVEGPTDTPIVEEYLKKFGIDANHNIKTWALGGDIMAQLDLTVFAERYKVIALIDKDPKSSTV